MIVFAVLFTFTLYRRKNNVSHIFFALFILASLFWVFSNYLVDILRNETSILIWSKLTILGPTLLPPFLLFFTYYFPTRKIKNYFIIVPIVLASVGILLLIPSAYNIESVIKSDDLVPIVNTGPLYIIFGIYFFVSMLLCIYNLLVSYRQVIGIAKLQIRYILIGVITTVLLALITNLILPSLGLSEYANLGPYFSIFFIVTTFYAIIRYRLMNIRLILARSILYFLLISVITSVFAFTTFFAGDVLQESGRYSKFLIFMAVSFIIVLALDPLKRLLAKITDDIFYKDKIDYQKLLRDISIIIAREIDLEILLSSLRTSITNSLKIKVADILVKKGNGYVSLLQPADRHFDFDSPMVVHLMKVQSVLITDEFYRETFDMPESDERHRKQQVLDELERQGIEFSAPVFLEGDLKAIIILGQKQSGDVYGTEDVQFFASLAPQVAVAIEKSQLYESIGEFNLKLQDKINKATRELKGTNIQLQDANEHLKQLDTAKSEFLSIASHQLRTPISALKGYLSMMLEGDFGPVPPKQRQVISDLFESAARLARLINIFLNVSRIESGRFKLDKTMVNMNDLVDSVIKELQVQAKGKNIQLNFKPDKLLPQMYLDSDKIREVILNLVDNAIKYTPKGSITIETYQEGKEFHFKSMDTGIGIRPEDAKSLFRKFVRGTGIAQINTQGSGLGLYIAQRVVTEHGGRIWVESPGLDKGSAFHFVLPIMEPPTNGMATNGKATKK